MPETITIHEERPPAVGTRKAEEVFVRTMAALGKGAGAFEMAQSSARGKVVKSREFAYASAESKMYADYNMPIYNPSVLVTKKGLSVFDEMRRDDVIKAVLAATKQVRLSTDWHLRPATEDNRDRQIADELGWDLRHMRGTLRKGLKNIYTALDYGFSITEIVPMVSDSPYGQRITLKKLATRKPHSFTFKTDGHGNILPKGGLLQRIDAKDIPLPLERFIIYSFNSDWDNPYGTSHLDSAYRSWFSKDWIIKFWNRALERYAGGIAKGMLPEGADDDDRARMLAILRNLQDGTSITLPSGFEVDILELAGAGLAAFERAIRVHNGMMAASLLQPNRLGFTDFEGGSYNLAEVQQKLWFAILDDLGEDTRETIMREQLLRRLVEWNYDGVTEYPTFEFDPLTEDDKFQMMDRVIAGVRAGLMNWTVDDEKWVRDLFGAPMLPEDIQKLLTARVISIAKATAVPPKKKGDDDDEEEPPDTKTMEQDGKGEAFAASDLEPHTIQRVPAEFTLLRSPFPEERHVDFAGVASRMEDDPLRGAKEIAKVGKKMKRDTLRWARRVMKNKDKGAVKKFRVPYMSDMQRAVEGLVAEGWLYGKLDTRHEIESALKEQDREIEWSREFVSPLGVALALLPWRARKALQGMVPVAASEVEAISERAIWVKGLERERLASEVQEILDFGLEMGDLSQVTDDLERLFDRYIKKGHLTVEGPARAKWTSVGHQAEVVARTNYSWAYNQGRLAMMMDPDVASIIEGVQWSSILDDRTTPYCEDMDGLVFKVKDVEPPPAHHQCRSFLVPVVYGDTVPKNRDWRNKEFPTEFAHEGDVVSARVFPVS